MALDAIAIAEKIGFTPDDSQIFAMQKIIDWYISYRNGRTPNHNEFRLGGLAGTGKSSIVRITTSELNKALKSLMKEKSAVKVAILQDMLQEPGLDALERFTIMAELKAAKNHRMIVRYCAYSGKAAMVLRKKGMNASTIHSLIYKTTTDSRTLQPVFKLRSLEEMETIDLIVVDEASMVNEEIYRDLMSFGRPVLFIGDHGQLPPVQGNFNLMDECDLYLEEVHRNAGWIVKLAMMAREGKSIPYKKFSDNVMRVPWSKIKKEHLSRADQVVCGTNRTRADVNDDLRFNFYGIDSPLPEEGEKMICRKNNASEGLFNGLVGKCLGKVTEQPKKGILKMDFYSENETGHSGLECDLAMFRPEIDNTVAWNRRMKLQKFEFAYALTCHLVQGSEFKKLLVIDEPFGDDDNQRRWRYTAYTRAQDVLVITD